MLPSGAGGGQILMAGLDSTQLRGFQLTGAAAGDVLGASRTYSASGLDMGDMRESEVLPDGETALAALRGGGLVRLEFSGSSVTSTTVASASGSATRLPARLPAPA